MLKTKKNIKERMNPNERRKGKRKRKKVVGEAYSVSRTNCHHQEYRGPHTWGSTPGQHTQSKRNMTGDGLSLSPWSSLFSQRGLPSQQDVKGHHISMHTITLDLNQCPSLHALQYVPGCMEWVLILKSKM